MKSLNTYLTEKLLINKNFKDVNANNKATIAFQYINILNKD